MFFSEIFRRLRPGAQQEDHRGADQEAQRDQLHPPQTPQALGVGSAVRTGQRLGKTWPRARECAGSGVGSMCHLSILRYRRD